MLDNILDGLAEVCVTNKMQIATAESCTGGLVAKLITDRPGSSLWFERGFVTYSNLAKEQMLGVKRSLLDEWGAVSEPVAEAMAEGVLKHSPAQFSLSITGIAGPDGGTDEKPVGTVCFGWAYPGEQGKTISFMTTTERFSGNREAIRTQSAIFSLQQLLQIMSSSIT